jgi:hypothetical protein
MVDILDERVIAPGGVDSDRLTGQSWDPLRWG